MASANPSPLADDALPGPGGVNAVEARALMDARGDARLQLLARARATRERYQGLEVRLCRGLSSSKAGPAGCMHAPAPGEPLCPADDLLGQVARARDGGAGQCGVNAVGVADRTAIESLLSRWKTAGGSVRCVATGSVTQAALDRLRAAGMQSVHHTLAMDRSPFPGTLVDPADDAGARALLQARYACLHVCGGGVLGEGEDRDQRQAWLATLRDMDVSAVLMVFSDPGEPAEARQALVAVARLMHPTRDVIVAGLDAEAALEAGASGIMAATDEELALAWAASARRQLTPVDVLHRGSAPEHVRDLADDREGHRAPRSLRILG